MVSLPNQVPVIAPQITVAPPKTYIRAFKSEHFLLLMFIMMATRTSKTPYPASPMIIAKKRDIKRRKYMDISFSLYPGTRPNISKRGWIILTKPL